MSKKKRQYVAIIGGFWHINDTSPDIYRDAVLFAQQLGASLADAGLGLVVYHSNPLALEPHVVAGFVSSLKDGHGAESIRLRFAESQRGEVSFVEQQHRPDVFHAELFASDEWEAPFYRSLVSGDSVDAALLMAGGKSTLIAGQIAMERGLPVLAIDRFPGAAAQVRSELARMDRGYPSSSTHTPAQMTQWLMAVVAKCENAARRHREASRRLARLESLRPTLMLLATTSVLLIATLAWGLQRDPPADKYAWIVLAGLICAGATGAEGGSLLGQRQFSGAGFAAIVGGIAGLVVGLAYLVPQWIGAPGVLDASSDEVTASDKIQFVASVLVAISAGTGADTIFARLSRQAEGQSISPHTST